MDTEVNSTSHFGERCINKKSNAFFHALLPLVFALKAQLWQITETLCVAEPLQFMEPWHFKQRLIVKLVNCYIPNNGGLRNTNISHWMTGKKSYLLMKPSWVYVKRWQPGSDFPPLNLDTCTALTGFWWRRNSTSFCRAMLHPLVCLFVENSYCNRIMTPNAPLRLARTTWITKNTWLSWTFLHSQLTSNPLNISVGTWRQAFCESTKSSLERGEHIKY